MSRAVEPTFLTNKELYLNQGEVTAPTLTLPDNRMLHVFPRRYKSYVDGIDNIVGKCGVTTVRDAKDFKKRNIFQTHNIWNGYKDVSQLNQDIIKNMARTQPLAYFECNDFTEGKFDFFDPNRFDNMLYYVAERKNVHLSNNIDQINIGDYGSNGYNKVAWRNSGGSNINPTDNFFKSRYSSQQAARSDIPFYQKGWDSVITPNVKDYIDTPDYDSRFFVMVHNAEINALAVGKVGGIGGKVVNYFTWGNLESLGGNGGSSYGDTLHSGLIWERNLTNPAGTLTVKGAHPQADYDYLVATSFIIGFCICGSKTVFDISAFSGTIPNWNTFKAQYNKDEVEIPDFSNQSYTGEPRNYPFYPNTPERWHDADYHAAFYYSQCYRTQTKPWKYIRYSLDGGQNWIEPTNDGSDILYHAEANDGPHSLRPNKRRGRGVAMGRFFGGAVDFWYYDPTLPKGKVEVVTVEINNFRFTYPMKAGKLNLFNE